MLDEMRYTPDMCLNYDDKMEYLLERFGDKYSHAAMQGYKNKLIYRIGEYEKILGKDYAFFTAEENKRLFQENKWDMNYTATSIISFLRGYIAYQKSKGKIDQQYIHPIEVFDSTSIVSVLSLKEYYFKGLDDLCLFLDEVFDDIVTHPRRDSRYLSYASIILLSWIGIPLKYVGDVFKCDLGDNSVGSRPLSCVVQNVDKRIMNVLKNYSLQQQYVTVSASGVKHTFKLCRSNRLFRKTVRTTGREWCEDSFTSTVKNRMMCNIQEEIKSLPIYSPHYAKHIRFSKIYENGLYDRLLQYQIEHRVQFNYLEDETSEIINALRYGGKSISRNQIKSMVIQYEKWKEYYHPDVNI